MRLISVRVIGILSLSATFAASQWWVRLLLAAVGVGVTIHLLRIPTVGAKRDPDGNAAVRVAPPTSDES